MKQADMVVRQQPEHDHHYLKVSLIKTRSRTLILQDPVKYFRNSLIQM